MQIGNRGRAPVEVSVGKPDFKQNPDGSLAFQENAPYSASNWVTVTPAKFRLRPGQTTEVEIQVALPEVPDAGEHQVALVFVVPAPPSTANIRVNRGVGLPVFLTVPGPVDDSVLLDNLRAPGFALRGPVRLSRPSTVSAPSIATSGGRARWGCGRPAVPSCSRTSPSPVARYGRSTPCGVIPRSRASATRP